MPDNTAREIQIFYLGEECDTCDIWLKQTKDGEWKKVNQVIAYKNDRKIINGVEYIVLEDGSQRKLLAREKKLWKHWDVPVDLLLETPSVSLDHPLHGYSVDGVQPFKKFKRR